jgi:fibronectin type 3 domain-containing protein
MMNKRRLTQAIVVFSLFCLATPLYAATPWLHTDGNVIKDPCGNTVVLRGVDLIDLGSLESGEGGVINMINRLTDKTNTEGNSPGWYPRVLRIMIAPPDSVSGWSYPFDPNNTVLYNLLRTTVDYCKTKDLYAIIDWHYVANTYDHVASTSQFWTYMAPKFANDSHVIFELFNEPINDLNNDWIFNSNDTADWLSVRTNMQTWINIVRSYAPNNLIFVAGSYYAQNIGPAATYPVTGDNIVIISHIYASHWLSSYSSSYQAEINTALTRYPVFMSEWGFSQSAWGASDGNITNYGQPLYDFREARKISNSAWVASYDWGPPMFWTNWTLRVGEGEMGGFTKDTLYLKKDANQPSDGNTIPPAAPTGLTATPSTGTITLNWDDNNEGDLYGYDIYRSTTSGGQTNRLNLVRSKISAYTDTNVAGTRTYYYVVTAVDTNFNSSADSIEVSATVPADSTAPAAPSGVSATGGDTIVSLNWNDNTEPDINGYNVYRSTTGGSPYTRQNGAPLSSSDFNDANVTNGTMYYYVVTAVDTSLNESANSSQVSARPQLNPIVGIIGSWITGTTHAKESGYNRALIFVAHTKGTTSSTPSLTAVTYGGRSMTKIIDRSTGSGSTRVYVAAFILNDANITAATSTTFTPTWTNQPPYVTYSSVFLRNVNQTTPVGASASNGVTSGITVSTSALANSNGDMVIEATADSVLGTYTLTSGWIKDLDIGSSNPDGMGGHKPATGASETPSITQSSGSHSLIGLVAKMAPNVAPAAPTGLTSNPTMEIIMLNWNDNNEPDFNGYNIYRSTTSGSGYVKLNSSLLSSSDYNDTDVSKGTIYYYVVTAVDTAGLESVYSGEISATLSSPASGTGAILREWWNDIPGYDISDLRSSENYPDNPSGREFVTKLEGPVNWGDNYGSQFLGYLNPLTSGNYMFWIASDYTGYLLLSTDDNPDNLEMIAYTLAPTDSQAWYTYSSQQSSPISLVAGQKYYIMVIHKASVGNDNISVAWEGPGISQQVIDGIYLSPCDLKFSAFASFANQWNRTDCSTGNDWCSGTDFDRNGTVDIDDLMTFADGWLTGNPF